MRRSRLYALLGGAALVLAVAFVIHASGCAQILGIEDLEEIPRPTDAGDAGGGGGAGGSAGAGGGGPTVVVLASGQPAPARIAVYGDDVYWVNRDSGELRRVSKVGGDPETLATQVGAVFADVAIAGDPINRIVWTTLYYPDAGGDDGGLVLRRGLGASPPVSPISRRALPQDRVPPSQSPSRLGCRQPTRCHQNRHGRRLPVLDEPTCRDRRAGADRVGVY